MALIAWKDEFVTGIKSIDEQHRDIVSSTNKLHEISNDPGASVDQVSDSLFELLEHAINHFISEEDLFQRLNYQDYASHKEHNDLFSQKAQTMIQELGAGVTLTENSLTYLKDWVDGHILQKDKAYVTFLKENGAQ